MWHGWSAERGVGGIWSRRSTGGIILAASYNFYVSDGFPSAASLKTPVQTNVPEIEENPQTAVALILPGCVGGFDEYDVDHDYVVRDSGRVFGKHFEKYLKHYRFNLYHNRDRGLLVVRTKWEVADDALARIKTLHPPFTYRNPEVDFGFVKQRAEMIAGGWFNELNQQHLRAAGYFGPHVDQSDEFKRASEMGSTRSLMITRSGTKGKEETIMITSTGGVVLYSKFDVPRDGLALALAIYEDFIAPSQSATKSTQMLGRKAPERDKAIGPDGKRLF